MRLSLLLRISLLSSLAAVLMGLQFPMFAQYLKYDPSEVPALIGTFALGPAYGAAIILLKNLLFLMTHFTPAEMVGVPLDTLAGLTFTLTAGSIYNLRKTKKMAVISLALGSVAMTLVMIPANLLLLPVFQKFFLPSAFQMTSEVLLRAILVTVTPFNLVKGALSSTLTFLIYKRFSAILKSEPLWESPLVPTPTSSTTTP